MSETLQLILAILTMLFIASSFSLLLLYPQTYASPLVWDEESATYRLTGKSFFFKYLLPIILFTTAMILIVILAK